MVRPRVRSRNESRRREGPLFATTSGRLTTKRASNEVSSFGHDRGYDGRILIPDSTLAMPGANQIAGFCFAPQDGNRLLTSIAVTLRFLHPEDWETGIQVLERFIFREI